MKYVKDTIFGTLQINLSIIYKFIVYLLFTSHGTIAYIIINISALNNVNYLVVEETSKRVHQPNGSLNVCNSDPLCILFVNVSFK